MKKFSNRVVIKGSGIEMNGSGIETITYTRDEQGRFLNETVTLEQFLYFNHIFGLIQIVNTNQECKQ